MKKYLIIIICVLCGIIAITLLYLKIQYAQTPLLTSTTYLFTHLIHPHKNLSKKIIGFLPYWKVSDIKNLRLEELSEINYFGLRINPDGTLLTQTGNETEPGFREWKTQTLTNLFTKAHIMGTSVSVTILNHNNTEIETLLDSQTAQETLIGELTKQIQEKKLNGITLDFEYIGTPEKTYKQKFTTFSELLTKEIKKAYPKVTITLSSMPRDARDESLFDFPKLVPLYDIFLVMSYDYYGASADISAPGAPMKGVAEHKYFFDITTTFQDYTKVVPREKLIMGIPYYGWDRTVTQETMPNSTTYHIDDPNNYAAVVSYARMKKEKIKEKNNCLWDYTAEATWCSYTDKETGLAHQAWLEDEKSLGIKYDFVNKQDLAGIAIWVLGYDNGYDDLWNLLETKFK